MSANHPKRTNWSKMLLKPLLGSSASSLTEVFIGVIKERRPSLDPHQIIFLRRADAGNHMRDSGRLLASELCVLEINGVDNFANCAQGRIVESCSIQQDFK